ncbi:unnamed protein product [Brachionus calyciflorus]|uniref:thiopurine S-methyltransferase n=1 Tax=Brachionus calyciflorus TaxID=104777 RepID=A0A814GEL2_9BILA|nr:unnamed protein product [Brachionus calyciflorus]
MSVQEENLVYSDAFYWKERWKNNSIEFHCKTNHKMLVKHLDKLTLNRQNLRFFFPLCGKSLDMAWLASLGHQVVGVEFVKSAIEEFFDENKMQFKLIELDKFKLYSSLDEKLKIYHGDFFDFSNSYEESFDCVWDRGGLVALPADQRQKYAEVIHRLLKKEFRYFLDAFEYDTSLYPGPPHLATLEELEKNFGCKCKIKLIDTNPSYRLFSESLKDKPPVELLYLLTNH